MSHLILRSAVFFLALVAFSAVLTPSTVSANPYDTFLVFRFHELRGLGDVDGALALLTDDAVVSGRGLCPADLCVGKAAIGPGIARAASLRTRTTIVSIAVSPNTVVAHEEVRQDNIRAFGLERVIQNATYQIKDDKIAAIRTVPDLSDPQTAAYIAREAAPAQPAVASSPIRPPATGDAGLATSHPAAGGSPLP